LILSCNSITKTNPSDTLRKGHRFTVNKERITVFLQKQELDTGQNTPRGNRSHKF
jgi:hypothetical protein